MIWRWDDPLNSDATRNWWPWTVTTTGTYLDSVPTGKTTYGQDGTVTTRYELPGFGKEHIQVSYTNKYISIKADNGEKKYSLSFFPVDGCDPDTITAGTKDGILTITYNYKQKSPPSKQIPLT